MNLRAELALSLAAHASPLPGLYFRPADQVRMEGCLAAVLREGRSLALSSQNEAVLGHYADLLIDRLRRSAPCPVEIYFPASTQAMVARFDELLAGMSVQEAMSEQPQSPAQRIWLVHDAGALAEHELQLLARLVTNFPGAGIRVVLLLGPGLRSRKGFDSLGRRFVRWDVEVPTPEQARTMLAQARLDGCDALVSELLRHVQPVRPAPATEQAPAEQRRSPAPEPAAPVSRWRRRLQRLRLSGAEAAIPQEPRPVPSAQGAGRSTPGLQGQGAAQPRAHARRRWLAASALAGLAVVSVATAFLWRPHDVDMRWLEQPVRQLLRSEPLSPTLPAVPRPSTEQRT